MADRSGQIASQIRARLQLLDRLIGDPSPVPGSQRPGGEAVGDDGQEDGPGRDLDHGIRGEATFTQSLNVNTTDARPLGPNQPMNSTLDGRSPVPISDTATGTIRTTVRLKTA